MATRATSFRELPCECLMKRISENFVGIAAGVLIGGAGALVHNLSIGWFPAGLVLALLGAISASKILGMRFGRRGIRIWFLLGWSALALRGSTFGNGEELLIMANGPGNTFLAVGFLLVLVSIWSRL